MVIVIVQNTTFIVYGNVNVVRVVFTGIKLDNVVTLAIRIQKQLDNIRYEALYYFYFWECLTEDGP